MNVHPDEIGWPSNINEFYEESYKEDGAHAKEWLEGQTDPYINPPDEMPDSISSFLDLFDDDEATLGDLSEFVEKGQIHVMQTNEGAATVYHSAKGWRTH